MKRGSKTEKVLEILVNGAVITAELIDVCFNYHESYRRARSRLYGGTTASKLPKATFANQQQLYSLLNDLKNQGLVEKKSSQKGTLWKITAAGLEKFGLIRAKKLDYQPAIENKLKIIVFDVPEKERFKRLWLGEALKLFGFKRLQKSVWIGKNKIPEDFIKDLHKKGMMGYVHILEVSRAGTIRELV